jgi:hydroxyethylthiazole kinase-like sugar kinase family protein
VAEPLSACLAALLAFRMAAERAEGSPWPASWKNAFLDALAALKPYELSEGMRSRTEGPLEFCKEAE